MKRRSRVIGFEVESAVVYSMASQNSPSTQPPPPKAGRLLDAALVHGLTLLTWNVPDFEGCGVEAVDPFAGVGF